MWRPLIAGLNADAKFHDGVDEQQLTEATEVLGHELPDQLADLLRETNGVTGEYGLGLVWPIQRIVADNVAFRSGEDLGALYMPFDPLRFFADAGNGDQFAFPRHPPRDDVFVWDHENDSRTWAARDLEQYLRWWLDGTLEL